MNSINSNFHLRTLCFFFIMNTVQWTFFIKARLKRHVFKLHLVIKILNYSVRNVYLSLNKRDLALGFRFFALFYLNPNCVLNCRIALSRQFADSFTTIRILLLILCKWDQKKPWSANAENETTIKAKMGLIALFLFNSNFVLFLGRIKIN